MNATATTHPNELTTDITTIASDASNNSITIGFQFRITRMIDSDTDHSYHSNWGKAIEEKCRGMSRICMMSLMTDIHAHK